MSINDNTKDVILDAFEAGLRKIDYPAVQIQKSYDYSDFLNDGQRRTVDLAAFGSGIPSLRTCNIAVSIEENVSAASLARLRALGAPLLFAYDIQSQHISRWRMTSDGMPIPLDLSKHIRVDRLPEYFFEKRQEWNPEAFRQARTAVFQQGAAQLDFLDLGLLPTLEGELQRKLSKQIQKIADQSRRSINEREGETAFERQFSGYARLLFRLLAARLLSDRGDLPGLTQSDNVTDVLQTIEKKYHVGEDAGPTFRDPVVETLVWDALREGIDLHNLSPETLAFVYENALVDKDLRRRNGIHSTPPLVADYLLRQLPVDRLPEAERVVFEPFCGNAPFLLAAMRRLRELLNPADFTSAEIHQYLVKRLLGIEILPFAREIARYSLILGDYPEDNNWQIAEADAFSSNCFDDYLQRASIVLSNPPHEAFERGNRPDGAHQNRAAEALRRVLVYPPKLLGFVMPLSFVDGDAYKMLRRQLVEIYPTLAVTAMPDNVFGKASQQTALIAAHRLDTSKHYSWTSVSAQEYRKTFPLVSDSSSSSKLVALPTSQDGTPILYQRLRGNNSTLWEAMKNLPELDNLAELHRGLRWQTLDGDSSSTSSAISDYKLDGFAAGVHRIDGGIEEYVITRSVFLDVRPDRKLYNALRRDWHRPKVLINAARVGGDLWRLLAIPDNDGLYASQQHLAVWLRPKAALLLTVETLSAVLNGVVANAFVFQRCRGRDNDISVLKRLPVPSFTSAQVDEITSLVDNYIELRWNNMDEPTPWISRLAEQGRRTLLKIDAAVLEAYGLSPNLEEELLEQFHGVERGHLPFAFNGYRSEELADVKVELAAERYAQQSAHQFADLLQKRNLFGLTPAEQEEYDYLQNVREASRARSFALLKIGK